LEVYHRLDNFQYILGRLQKSVGALTGGIIDKKTESVPKKFKVRLKRLEGRLRTDAEELTGHTESTVMLISQLRESERHVNETGNAFHNSFQAMSTALRLNGFLQADDDHMHEEVLLIPTPTSGSEDSDAATSPMADQLAIFCDAVGTFKIMRERIDELHLEKQEQEERKDFLSDQELRLERRNENFLLTWNQRLANAEKDYQEAVTAVELGRKLCVDANVSIPSWAETNPTFGGMYQNYDGAAQLAAASSAESVIHQQSSGQGMGSSTNSSGPVAADTSSPFFNSLNNRLLTDDKISKWIEGVPVVADSIPELPAVPTHASTLTDAHSPKNDIVVKIRRTRSLSYLPSATCLESTHKSPASCPSILDTSRSLAETYGSPLEVTGPVACTAILMSDNMI
jgi:hypothetical protein